MPDISRFADSLEWIGAALLGLAALFALIALVKWLGRRSSNGGGRGAATERRLAVLDQVALDDKRRLVLIRRDDVQHLVILGGANELLVESGIGAARPGSAELIATRQPPVRSERDAPARPAPIPVAPREVAPAAPQVPPAPRAEARPAPAPVVERAAPPPSPPPPPQAMPAPVPEPIPAPRPEPQPATPSYTFDPAPAPASDPRAAAGEPRVAVKVDPQFAAMSGRLEEILRRPFDRDPASEPAASPAAPPVMPHPVEAAARPAPEVLPPATADGRPKDDLESQMASLLGRAPTR